MKTINIKGKEYVPVVERVKEFHKIHPFGQIITEVISNGTDRVSVKATVKIPPEKGMEHSISTTHIMEMDKPERIFTGHSQAIYDKGLMGNVALEVAETSAVGRALGFANIGLIEGIASADEMRKISPKTPDGSDEPF